MKALKLSFAVLLIAALCTVAGGQQKTQSFMDAVGPVKVGEVVKSAQTEKACITWGGDIYTIYANGGVTTQPGSIYHKLGLNFKLVLCDDTIQQARDCLAGKRPMFRQVFHTAGIAAELFAQDQRTKLVVTRQLTWSTGGDNAVVRSERIKSMKDVKVVCLQRFGPHIVMLDDMLRAAQMKWEDITVIWADDLTGDKGPGELSRKNDKIDICFVISPDVPKLTGGFDKTGTGRDETVKGARVMVSTAQLSRSIADIDCYRSDFYNSNRSFVERDNAGYLKAVEEVIELRKIYEANPRAKEAEPYRKLLQQAQDFFGKEAVPTLDDAHGMIADCTPVGHPGNVAFFTDEKNEHGFKVYCNSAAELAVRLGFGTMKVPLIKGDVDWSSAAFTKYLTKLDVKAGTKFDTQAVLGEITKFSEEGTLDEQTLAPPFAVKFKPNVAVFTAEDYAVEFKRVLEGMDKFGNAIMLIRGHADPTATLRTLVEAGKAKGILQQSGSQSMGYSYALQGKPLDLTATKQIVQLIESGAFDGVAEANPRQVMQAALNGSVQRAEALKNTLISYAQGQGRKIEETQVQVVGVGVKEPFIAKPTNMVEAMQNMRAEFRMIRVSAEVTKKSDFDF